MNVAATGFPTLRLRFACSVPLKYGANAAAQFDDPNWPRFVRITDITEDGRLKEDTFRSLPPEEATPYILNDGDVLLARSGSIGRSFIYKQDWGTVCHAGYLIRARLSKQFDPKFVYWALNSATYWAWIEGISIRSTIQNVSAEKYADYAVPAPPFETQRRIAQFLDEKTARIDALVEKKRALLDRLAEKRQALITRAVTKGLNPDAPMKPSGIDWLGDIPAHWEVAPLRWYLRTASGEGIRNENLSTHRDENYPIPVIGGNGLMGYSHESNSLDTLLVVGRVGALCGNVHLVSEPSWVTDNALKVYGIRNYEVTYLLQVLRVRDLNTLASRNAQPLMTGEVVRSQVMPMPPLEEQLSIAEFIVDESETLDRQSNLINLTVARLHEYRAALITAAVTGQLEVA